MPIAHNEVSEIMAEIPSTLSILYVDRIAILYSSLSGKIEIIRSVCGNALGRTLYVKM